MKPDLHMMPPEHALPMPVQDLKRTYRDTGAPGTASQLPVFLWRVLAFVPAMAATGALLWIMLGWFGDEGLTGVEITLLALICFNFFWISFTVSTVVLGLWSLTQQPAMPRPDDSTEPLNVALLMPVHNEVPWYVLGSAQSMLEELRARGGAHRYAMFILSDTQDDDIAAQEEAAVLTLQSELSTGLELYYRRRPINTDRKVGNIADWIQRWGGGWQAMLVLDADSLMTGRAITRLSDALARDPRAGLIQSFPQLIGAQSVFARMQQFANGVYGAALAEGLARWCGQEGNYWGHNAIIRTGAFAACAGLPRVRSLSGRKSLIMSHDFVEAGLLRRAGWAVRFLPRIRGSYEETPQTLIDHIQRDRRWCQGNLQHLNLLWSRGFAPVSRFHLFHGAMGYLMSPIWFGLLLIWALLGQGEEGNLLTYFSPDNPLMPTWPEMTEARHVLIIVLMYAMLLAPKILGVVALPLSGARFREFGGGARFALSFVSEVCLSILYAPIQMVQQMIAVFRTLLGLQKGWSPQSRSGGQHSYRTLFYYHSLETISGAALMAGILAGLISPWLLPIAVSLALAVPLSALSGLSVSKVSPALMGTREEYYAPAVTRAATHYRSRLRAALDGGQMASPAE